MWLWGTSTTRNSYGSQVTPSIVAEDDFGLADGELVAFAAHGFDQHREVQQAAARDFEGVAFVAGLDAQSDVGLELAVEPFLDVARGEVLPLAGQAGNR